MGFIGDMLNTSKGAGFTGSGAYLDNAISVPQTDIVRDLTMKSIYQNQDLYNQLAGQGGVQNQSNVFNQQQQLANQLGLQAQGQGPNPALAQLALTTGQNVAQQSALMGSQRGASANPALIARQAAQQGAGMQQQATGQAAVLRAQQQLAAQQALQQQQGMMGNLAGQQVGQQMNVGQNLAGQYQNQLAMMLNQINAQNSVRAGMQGNINSVNAGIAQGNQAQQAKASEKVLGGVGAAMGLAGGGEVPHYDMGGSVGPQSMFGRLLQQQQSYSNIDPSLLNTPVSSPKTTTTDMTGGLANKLGDKFHSYLTTPMRGATDITPGGFTGADASSALPLAAVANKGGLAMNGGHVPGKAKVDGDSLKNDTVPAMLSPEEIVLPRSVTKAEDAPDRAAKFVQAVLAKHNLKRKTS